MTAPITSTVSLPPGLAIAPQLPDLLLPVKIRRGTLGFLRNHPTVAIGAALLIASFLLLLSINLLQWWARKWQT